MTEVPLRQPHAALDAESRKRKAKAIVSTLLRQGLPKRHLRCLEVGAGAGYFASFLALQSGLDVEVDAVDVLDQRQVSDGYRFRQVLGVELPFEAGVFDVVVSNHVIEHVGDIAAQGRHLQEMARVLRRDGLAYLACPSRWQVVEPHYRLLFLSWLPRRWRSAYLRRFRGVPIYDCEPLDCPQIERLVSDAGLFSRRAVDDALQSLEESSQRRSALVRAAAALPNPVLRLLSRASPTHVYLLAHARERLVR